MESGSAVLHAAASERRTAITRSLRTGGLGRRAFVAVNYAALGLLSLVSVYPFWNLAASSVSGSSPLKLHEVFLWPLEPQLDAFRFLFEKAAFWSGMRVTAVITVLGTLLGVALTAIFAYPLSKRDFRWRRPLTLMVVVTMFFSGGLIPEYLLYRYLGMLNRLSVLIIPGAISTWSLLILRNFFQQIPESIEDSARIDGAGELTILARIIVPMSMPILATITLWYVVAKWNTFSQCVYFTSATSLRTIQVALRNIVLNEDQSGSGTYAYINPRYAGMSRESIAAAAIVATTLPMLLVYPFLQKYFVKGIIVGSLKG